MLQKENYIWFYTCLKQRNEFLTICTILLFARDSFLFKAANDTCRTSQLQLATRMSLRLDRQWCSIGDVVIRGRSRDQAIGTVLHERNSRLFVRVHSYSTSVVSHLPSSERDRRDQSQWHSSQRTTTPLFDHATSVSKVLNSRN